MQQYTTQEFGYMLVAVGTLLLAIVGILWLAYGIYLAIPTKVQVIPADLRTDRAPTPPPVFLQGRMSPQRVQYTPRHQASLSAPQDPWMATAYTEVR